MPPSAVPFRSRSVRPSDARAEIDRKIKLLCSERNQLSPIFVLPPELLARVFLLYRDSKRSYNESPFRSWVQPSYVCRYWRNVALNCPSLWTQIPLKPVEWQETVLERSKQTPLSLCFDPWRGDNLENLIPSIMNRLEDLEIHCDKSSIWELQTLFPPIATPKLRSVYIEVRYSVPAIEPLEIFVAKPPSLHTLRLSGQYFQWDSPIYHGLTHLELAHVKPALRATVNQIFDILEQSPGLQTLKLTHVVRSSVEEPVAARTRIDLRSLSRVEIGCSTDLFTELFSHLNIPALGELVMDCRASPSFDSYDILPILLSVFEKARLVGKPVLSLHLQGRVPKTQRITIAAWTSVMEKTRIPDFASALCDIQIRMNTESVKDDDLTMEMITALETNYTHFKDLRHLSIFELDFKKLPNVHYGRYDHLAKFLKTKREAGATVEQLNVRECAGLELHMGWMMENVVRLERKNSKSVGLNYEVIGSGDDLSYLSISTDLGDD